MAGTFRHMLNMANSIIGVSILSMPYCFKESGLLLGVLLILFSGFITKKTCMFLIKAAIMSRRRCYELLAFQIFGVTGKLLMEMCMIFFLIGICISFHVVMGDLAPSIVAKYLVIENSPSLRCTLLVGMMLLVILPLCLLRNFESLASMSACSIGFYVFLNCIIFYLALPNLLEGSWIFKAKLFQLDSAFRAFPIITLALSCQSNVFEIYDSIPDPDVVRMKSVVSQAVNICCGLYIGVGFLGYIAFVDKDVGGNIIMSFPISHLTDGITMFFVFSLAISFPLVLFPCRTSIHSLIYKRNAQLSYDLVGNYMPESRFKTITVTVLTSSLIVGILVPNIEFVLGLLGSTMGVIIALILPSIFYIKVYTKTSYDRLLAQGFFLLGIMLMVIGTYLHLDGLDNAKAVTEPPIKNFIQAAGAGIAENSVVKDLPPVPVVNQVPEDSGATGRKEPVIPEPPPNDEKPKENSVKDPILVEEKQEEVQKQSMNLKGDPPEPHLIKGDANIKREEEKVAGKIGDSRREEKSLGNNEKAEEDILKVVKKAIKEEDLHPDAIKKEEKENAEEAQAAPSELKENIEKKQEQILKQMEHQQKEQKKLIEEQKKILQELKDQKENMGNEAQALSNLAQVPKGGLLQQLQQPQQQQSLQQLQHLQPQQQQSLQQPQQQQSLQQPQQQQSLQQPQQQQSLQQPQQQQSQQQLLQQQPQQHLNEVPDKEEKLASGIGRNALPNLTIEKSLKSNQYKDPLGNPLSNESNHINKNVELSNTFNRSPVDKQVQPLPKKTINEDKPLANPAPSLKASSGLKARPFNQIVDSGLYKRQKTTSDTNLRSKSLSDKVPSQSPGKALPEQTDLKHDEERRKRDLVSVVESSNLLKEEVPLISLRDPQGGIQYSNHLSIPSKKSLKSEEGLEDMEPKMVDALYETRHLLSFGYKTRRRKRRKEQFPEYWDEM